MTTKKIYKIVLNEKVIAIFDSKKFALDFIEYQKTISDFEFEIQKIDYTDWLLEPKDF